MIILCPGPGTAIIRPFCQSPRKSFIFFTYHFLRMGKPIYDVREVVGYSQESIFKRESVLDMLIIRAKKNRKICGHPGLAIGLGD